jgi:hypothetical protein
MENSSITIINETANINRLNNKELRIQASFKKISNYKNDHIKSGEWND